jgi:hypothetical protein
VPQHKPWDGEIVDARRNYGGNNYDDDDDDDYNETFALKLKTLHSQIFMLVYLRKSNQILG